VAQLCQHSSDLERRGAEVVLISFGAPEVARVWLEEMCPSFRLLLDPERNVYRAYGLQRSWRRSWNLRTLWRYMQLLSSGRKWRGIKGDSAQLGGDFVIGRNGTIRLAYRSHDPTDRPSAAQLLAVLRETDGGAPAA
jgi:peroxiredoxin